MILLKNNWKNQKWSIKFLVLHCRQKLNQKSRKQIVYSSQKYNDITTTRQNKIRVLEFIKNLYINWINSKTLSYPEISFTQSKPCKEFHIHAPKSKKHDYKNYISSPSHIKKIFEPLKGAKKIQRLYKKCLKSEKINVRNFTCNYSKFLTAAIPNIDKDSINQSYFWN